MVPNDEPAWFNLNGYTVSLNQPLLDLPGVTIVCTKIDNWNAPAPSNGALTKRGQQDGGYSNYATRDGRSIVLWGWLSGDTYDNAIAGIRQLIDCIPVEPVAPLIVKDSNITRWTMVKQEGTPLIAHDDAHDGWYYDWSIHLISPSSDLTYVDASGGTGWGHTVSTPMGASGNIVVTNAGTSANTPMLVTISGATNPTITLDDGQQMKFEVAVGSGSHLVIDFLKQSIMLDGVNARSSLRGRWLRLAKGTNTLAFAADSISGQMTVNWSDADK